MQTSYYRLQPQTGTWRLLLGDIAVQGSCLLGDVAVQTLFGQSAGYVRLLRPGFERRCMLCSSCMVSMQHQQAMRAGCTV